MAKNVTIYPEKNQDVIIRWVVEYKDSDDTKRIFCESEERAERIKSDLEEPEEELDELINAEDGGLIHGDMPQSVGSNGSNEITSKSTTDDVVNTTRQGVSRWFSYRRFYGEGVEDGISTPIKNTPIAGADTQFLGREINEVDKTVEALGSIYAQSTDPIDFENKAKAAGYDDDEIAYRQEKFFRKTSDEQEETNNTKIPLEEIDIVEDVITNKTKRNDIVSKTRSQQISSDYSIPYYEQLREKNPLIARKLIYLMDMVKREELDPKNKAALIWQFLNGIGISDLEPEDKQYIIKYLQNGQ